jgi:hypothetical protein
VTLREMVAAPTSSAASWRGPENLSAEAAADLGLTRDFKELTAKLGLFFGLRDREGLSRGALERIGNRVESERRGGAPDLAQLPSD